MCCCPDAAIIFVNFNLDRLKAVWKFEVTR
jgi:hypothetical protein